jgi:hypothetical protein
VAGETRAVVLLIHTLGCDGVISNLVKSVDTGPLKTKKIAVVTRRAIMDELILGKHRWSAELNEHDFLERLYDLKTMPSSDGRFEDASGDIYKHRVMNSDGPPDWFLTDSRFNLLYAPDEDFLRFLSETLHPMVRSEADVAELVSVLNEHLASDGWEIYERGNISGKPIFGGRHIQAGGAVGVSAAKSVAKILDAEYVHRQIKRLEDAIDKDPELAIGTAKEFVETLCITILRERGVSDAGTDDFPALVRATVKALTIVPDGLPASEKTEKTIRVILSNLSSLGHHLAELRNPFGTGHGKDAVHVGLEKHHARLAVGAASVLAAFLFDCHEASKNN